MVLPLALGAVAAAFASQAGAQIAGAFGQPNAFELDDIRARQEAAERRATLQANEMMALEARLRAEQAVGGLTLQQRLPLTAPQSLYPSSPTSSGPSAAVYPSMPDAALADSNRRVRDAARGPR